MLFERNPTVIVYRDVNSLSHAAAELFTQIADRALQERQRLAGCTLGWQHAQTTVPTALTPAVWAERSLGADSFFLVR